VLGIWCLFIIRISGFGFRILSVNVLFGIKMRITRHPIIEFKRGKKVKFNFEGQELEAYKGETVAAALIASGVKVFKYSKRHKRPLGFFCAIGKCSSCLMEINGVQNQMACMRLVEEGMKVKRQI